MPGILDDLRSRFAALPAAQRAVIGVGVPLTAGAALVANLRGRSAESSSDADGSQDPGIPGQRVPIPAADNYDLVRAVERLSLTDDRIFGALVDAEGRLTDRISAAIDAIRDIPEASTPATGGGDGSLPVPAPTPEPSPGPGPALSPARVAAYIEDQAVPGGAAPRTDPAPATFSRDAERVAYQVPSSGIVVSKPVENYARTQAANVERILANPHWYSADQVANAEAIAAGVGGG